MRLEMRRTANAAGGPGALRASDRRRAALANDTPTGAAWRRSSPGTGRRASAAATAHALNEKAVAIWGWGGLAVLCGAYAATAEFDLMPGFHVLAFVLWSFAWSLGTHYAVPEPADEWTRRTRRSQIALFPGVALYVAAIYHFLFWYLNVTRYIPTPPVSPHMADLGRGAWLSFLAVLSGLAAGVMIGTLLGKARRRGLAPGTSG